MGTAFSTEAKYYDAFHRNKDYRQEAEDLRSRFPAAKSVLEIGAGTGLLTRELVSLGFDVTALEPSPEMCEEWRRLVPRATLVQATIQKFRPTCRYDLAVAHYDVLNYVPFSDIDAVLAKLKDCSKEQSIEIWPAKEGVRFFTYRREGSLRRVRIGIRWFGRAFCWHVFWGGGFVVNRHDLYLHKGLE